MHQSDPYAASCDTNGHNPNETYPTKLRYINIFIGGVGITETEGSVLEVINKFADVQYLKLIREKNKPHNKGFGFLHVRNMEEAQKILDAEIKINGKLAETYVAHPRREARRKIYSDRNKKIFIGGLTLQTTSKDLKNFFTQYGVFGKLLRAYVIYDSVSQLSRCFGFLEFDNEEDPKNILKIKHFTLNSHIIEAKSMILKKELEETAEQTDGVNSGIAIAIDPVFQNHVNHLTPGHYQQSPSYHPDLMGGCIDPQKNYSQVQPPVYQKQSPPNYNGANSPGAYYNYGGGFDYSLKPYNFADNSNKMFVRDNGEMNYQSQYYDRPKNAAYQFDNYAYNKYMADAHEKF
jgi:RNA recognition motif-containing protein